MSDARKIFYLLLTVVGIFLFPYIGAWIKYDGHFPKDYFDFPATTHPEKAGFNLTVFIVLAIMFASMLALYFFPRLFGFKKPKPVTIPIVIQPLVKAPFWLWLGLVMWVGTLIVFCGKFSEPRWLLNWGSIPLFWGFTLSIDGWIYLRNGGKSLIREHPHEVIGIGFASIFGWMIFEFLNFFVLDNWVYPFGDLIPDDEFVVYAFIGSSGLMPMVFQWYYLLNSFRRLRERYSNGPKINMARWVRITILILSFAGLFLTPFFPNVLFFLLWTSPLFILSVVLTEIGVWTPYRPIKDGNWAPLMLMAITFLIQGVLVECWNYFSGYHENGVVVKTYNPDYWTYSVPYVDVLPHL